MLILKTRVFQKLSRVWCNLKTIFSQKSKSTLLMPFFFVEKHMSGRKDNTVKKRTMDLFEHISPCPRTCNNSLSFSLSLQQIAQELPTSGASRASAEQRWNSLTHSLCLLCALLQSYSPKVGKVLPSELCCSEEVFSLG